MAVSVVVDPRANSCLRGFEEKVRRIAIESYEVAFVVCNRDMEEFGCSKIFDVFDQVFTTAFVLNTGYWPFFSTIHGQSLCVCGRFGVPCRHTKSLHHWIDMQPIEHQPGQPIFYPKVYGPVFPLVRDADVFIKPISDHGHGYDISIIINLQYKRFSGRPYRRDKYSRAAREMPSTSHEQMDIQNQIFSMQIYARYYLHNQYYPTSNAVIFEPSPFFNENYGTYFRHLLFLRNSDPILCMQPQMYCLANAQIPSSTFLLNQVNVPMYITPDKILAYQPFHRNPWLRRGHIKTHVKEDASNGFGYGLKDIINGWTYYPDGYQIVSESLKNFASTSSNNENVADIPGESIVINDSEEYDSQLPNIACDRVIKPENGISQQRKSHILRESCNQETVVDKSHTAVKPKKPNQLQYQNLKKRLMGFPFRTIQVTPQMVEALTKSCQEPDSTTTNEDTISVSDLSLVIPEEPKPSTSNGDCLKISKQGPSAKLETIEWFNKNFPPLPGRLELDEELELIENIIKEDILEEQKKTNND